MARLEKTIADAAKLLTGTIDVRVSPENSDKVSNLQLQLPSPSLHTLPMHNPDATRLQPGTLTSAAAHSHLPYSHRAYSDLA